MITSHRPLGLLLLLAGCAMPGCAGGPPKPAATPRAVEAPAPEPPPLALEQQQTSKVKSAKAAASDGLLVKTPAGAWAIRRAALQQLQRQGAQTFIQRVRVRPAFARGRFTGWRVLSYDGPGALRPGDVVRSVNGAPIERPEQFMKVWQQMAEKSHFSVQLVRGGQPIRARWPIVD